MRTHSLVRFALGGIVLLGSDTVCWGGDPTSAAEVLVGEFKGVTSERSLGERLGDLEAKSDAELRADLDALAGQRALAKGASSALRGKLASARSRAARINLAVAARMREAEVSLQKVRADEDEAYRRKYGENLPGGSAPYSEHEMEWMVSDEHVMFSVEDEGIRSEAVKDVRKICEGAREEPGLSQTELARLQAVALGQVRTIDVVSSRIRTLLARRRTERGAARAAAAAALRLSVAPDAPTSARAEEMFEFPLEVAGGKPPYRIAFRSEDSANSGEIVVDAVGRVPVTFQFGRPGRYPLSFTVADGSTPGQGAQASGAIEVEEKEEKATEPAPTGGRSRVPVDPAARRISPGTYTAILNLPFFNYTPWLPSTKASDAAPGNVTLTDAALKRLDSALAEGRYPKMSLEVRGDGSFQGVCRIEFAKGDFTYAEREETSFRSGYRVEGRADLLTGRVDARILDGLSEYSSRDKDGTGGLKWTHRFEATMAGWMLPSPHDGALFDGLFAQLLATASADKAEQYRAMGRDAALRAYVADNPWIANAVWFGFSSSGAMYCRKLGFAGFPTAAQPTDEGARVKCLENVQEHWFIHRETGEKRGSRDDETADKQAECDEHLAKGRGGWGVWILDETAEGPPEDAEGPETPLPHELVAFGVSGTETVRTVRAGSTTSLEIVGVYGDDVYKVHPMTDQATFRVQAGVAKEWRDTSDFTTTKPGQFTVAQKPGLYRIEATVPDGHGGTMHSSLRILVVP